jgi:type II secretion system protein J
LIEVLISIVILSIITIITSSFLQSSIESRELVSTKSDQTLEINLLSNTLRTDINNAINVPLINFDGFLTQATFKGEIGSNGFTFVTKLGNGNATDQVIAKVQYYIDDGAFVRKQFFASSPSDPESFIETQLMQDIEYAQIEFSDGNNWFYTWPQNEITTRKIPTLIKVFLEKESSENFTWVIPHTLPLVYE